MRIPLRTHRGRIAINMTPMIDVVFLLIIFFLVSSHLAKQEVQAELDLPVAETGEENTEATQRRITINVLEKNGSYQILFGARPVPLERLSAQLTEELASAADNLEVRVRADRSGPYRVIEPLLVSCARLDIWNVQFAVIRSENGAGHTQSR